MHIEKIIEDLNSLVVKVFVISYNQHTQFNENNNL